MRKVRGFTLVEIIVAIIVLGVLASIAIPKYLKVRETAMNAVKDAAVNMVRTAMTIAYAKNHDFPTNEQIAAYLRTSEGQVEIKAVNTGIEIPIERTGEIYTVLTFTDENCSAATGNPSVDKVMCVKGHVGDIKTKTTT